MEQPNIPKALAIARKHGWQFDIMSTSFFLSRRTLRPSAKIRHADLAGPPVHLARRGRPTTPPSYFQIPTGRVVEVGTQVTV